MARLGLWLMISGLLLALALPLMAAPAGMAVPSGAGSDGADRRNRSGGDTSLFVVPPLPARPG